MGEARLQVLAPPPTGLLPRKKTDGVAFGLLAIGRSFWGGSLDGWSMGWVTSYF